MAEIDKMSTGELYYAGSPEFESLRMKAKELIYRYNNLHPSEHMEGQVIMKELLGSTGEKFLIEKPFYCDYGYNIHIGDNFYANIGVTILDCGRVNIGNNVLIGPNVGIYPVGHPENIEARNTRFEYSRTITIGNNVWIGGHVVITPGVTIGDNSIIGAGSVVTRDIPENVVAAGNPCRVLRPCKIK